ncbi:PorP/SprF family type IX secretion system membrane protein [Flavobacterium sp. HTF]|uniref:PorP/SprF family type IX secretion system membrane protein n=1 Tax=Flavobacterium sp. HTF TaxID=2170732 RepID=UPI000D5F5A57|nr:PorP/SprF family type IX secretion system membrane protein [Flavobacterium sp. HTF]PWB25187.1 hypothetical protein DCO46_09765 [Flavobacterium sp. HTF]
MKRIVNTLLITLLLIIFLERAYAQQTPVYSTYNYNTVLINPAHAGFYENTDMVLTTDGYFNSAVDGSPRSFDVSLNTLAWSDKVGLAAGISHDEIGVTNTTSFFTSYAYKIHFNSGKEEKASGYNSTFISFGLTAGGMLYNENLTKLGLENDPEFQEDINVFTPTLGLGFLYNRENLYVGISAPNVLNSAFNSKNNTNLENVYYGYFGYRFFKGELEDVVITPGFLAKYTEGAPFQADLNLLVNYKNKVEFGGGYRTSDTVNLLAGFYIKDNFKIICTYNKSFDNVVIPDTFGLVLNYRFGRGFEY